MKARIALLVVLAILAVTVWLRNERAQSGQKHDIFQPKQAEQRLEALKNASAEASKAYEQAHDEVVRTWKIATQIRERDGIMDPAPCQESKPTSGSGNPEDLKAPYAGLNRNPG